MIYILIILYILLTVINDHLHQCHRPKYIGTHSMTFEYAPASITEIIDLLKNQHDQSYIGHENVAQIFSEYVNRGILFRR